MGTADNYIWTALAEMHVKLTLVSAILLMDICFCGMLYNNFLPIFSIVFLSLSLLLLCPPFPGQWVGVGGGLFIGLEHSATSKFLGFSYNFGIIDCVMDF